MDEGGPRFVRTLRLNPELDFFLRVNAATKKVSVAMLIREILDNYRLSVEQVDQPAYSEEQNGRPL